MKGLENEVMHKAAYIGAVGQLAERWMDSKNSEERFGLFNVYQKIMAKSLDGKKNPNPFDNLEPENLATTLQNADPDAMYRHMQGAVMGYAEKFSEEYKKNHAGLVKAVKSKLDEAMAGKDAPHAVEAIQEYFAEYFAKRMGLRDVDDATAAQMAKKERLAEYGSLANWDVSSMPTAEYKAKLKGLRLRNIVGQALVKENKKGKKSAYTVDEEALAEIMKNVIDGCLIYSRVMAPKKKA